MKPIWIKTAQAARLVGYNRDAFRRKFAPSFIGVGAAFETDCGYVLWLRVAVLAIVPEGKERSNVELAS